MRPTVVVVGGGIAGLSAAWELTAGNTWGAHATEPASVAVLESEDRFGGKLLARDVDGLHVDVGPDGFLGRRREAVDLCNELGLGDDLVPIGASGASVWARGRRRPLPSGHYLGVPTRIGPVARSGILGFGGTLRLALDVVAPRPDRRGPLGDRAIGPLVERKLGHQVVDRLVDPLVGGIHASGVADASAAALFPALLGAAAHGGSLVRALRRGARAEGRGPEGKGAGADRDAGAGKAQGAGDPAFWSLRGGLASLAPRMAEALERRGASLRTSARAVSLTRSGGRWQVETEQGTLDADAVVLALPAYDAAGLLDPLDADAAASLRSVAYASVALVTCAYDAASVPDDLPGTGLLVPRTTPYPPLLSLQGAGGRTAPDGTFLVTACTYLWAKWPHAGREGVRLVRASVGRLGDERFTEYDDTALVDRVTTELGALCRIGEEPRAAIVTRWPRALPEYRVHHLLRVASVEAAVRRLGPVALAGAAYHGVGIPACIASGRAAAHELAHLLEGEGSPSSA